MKKENKNNKKTKIDIEKKNNMFSKFFNKYATIIYSLLIVVVFTVVMSVSYAFFTTTLKAKEFIIYTGNLAVNYSKKTNVINVDKLYPMTNTEGLIYYN